jgi:hypothetical protein
MNKDFLEDTEPEFDFIEGIEGGSHLADLAAGAGFYEFIDQAIANRSMYAFGTPYFTITSPEGFAEPKREVPSAVLSKADWLDRCTKDHPPSLGKDAKWNAPWPMYQHVWQATEGAGKSSIVSELVQCGFKVVFCSKTNDQLVEHQEGFKARWPELQIERYVSKGRHLQEQLATIGIDFELSYYEPTSPYSPAVVDEPSTRQALKKALAQAGYETADHHEIFAKYYSDYKAPPIVGLDTDVILLTIAAFQALCSSKHRPWWQKLGLLAGTKRSIERYGKDIWVEVGLPKIMIIIDDPDRTDFDECRLVDDEDAVALHNARGKLPKYQEPWRDVNFHLKQGHPPLLAAELAKYHDDRAKTHEIQVIEKEYFEKRPETMRIGYGVHRGYAKNDPKAPHILVTTTEHITARLAIRSLDTAMKWAKGALNRGKPKFKPAKECHVTIFDTSIVRKGNHALLLLIVELLREEFPGDDLSFIADGLGCDLNLSNNRGRNDLADRSSLIKLSIPNPVVAKNLWAQFPEEGNARALNALLLVDLANQAIGRNQGNRYRGKPAMVLIDPMYARMVVQGGLLRYQFTPWSFHKPEQEPLVYHHPEMLPIERRLIELLEIGNARRLGMGIRGFELGQRLTNKQRKHYEAWLDAQGLVFPWPRVPEET